MIKLNRWLLIESKLVFHSFTTSVMVAFTHLIQLAIMAGVGFYTHA